MACVLKVQQYVRNCTHATRPVHVTPGGGETSNHTLDRIPNSFDPIRHELHTVARLRIGSPSYHLNKSSLDSLPG